LAFARIREGGGTSPLLRWALIAVAIALAQWTYQYIERPVRLGANRMKSTAVAAVAVAALGLVGLQVFKTGDLFFLRISPVTVVNRGDIGQNDFQEYLDEHFSLCDVRLFRRQSGSRDGDGLCRQSSPNGVPQIVILGDSHAEHLFPGLAEALPGRNVGYYWANALPFLDDPHFSSIYRSLAKETGVKTVVLSAFWVNRIRGLDRGVSMRAEMTRAVRFLRDAGKTVVVTDDILWFPFRPALCKYAGRLGAPNRCEANISLLERQLGSYVGDLTAVVAANPGTRLIDTAHMLCSDSVCSMAASSRLLYRDEDHLNINGSRLIGAKIIAADPDLAN